MLQRDMQKAQECPMARNSDVTDYEFRAPGLRLFWGTFASLYYPNVANRLLLSIIEYIA